MKPFFNSLKGIFFIARSTQSESSIYTEQDAYREPTTGKTRLSRAFSIHTAPEKRATTRAKPRIRSISCGVSKTPSTILSITTSRMFSAKPPKTEASTLTDEQASHPSIPPPEDFPTINRRTSFYKYTHFQVGYSDGKRVLTSNRRQDLPSLPDTSRTPTVRRSTTKYGIGDDDYPFDQDPPEQSLDSHQSEELPGLASDCGSGSGSEEVRSTNSISQCSTSPVTPTSPTVNISFDTLQSSTTLSSSTASTPQSTLRSPRVFRRSFLRRRSLYLDPDLVPPPISVLVKQPSSFLDMSSLELSNTHNIENNIESPLDEWFERQDHSCERDDYESRYLIIKTLARLELAAHGDQEGNRAEGALKVTNPDYQRASMDDLT